MPPVDPPGRPAPANGLAGDTSPHGSRPWLPRLLGRRQPGQAGLRSAWKTDASGRTVFRLIPPLVLWWAWLAFAAANVADLAIESHDWFAVKVSAVMLLVTAVMYACALRPRVATDAAGVTVTNPFRDYQVPWGSVTGVFVGDSVEIHCRRPAGQPGKTVYSWALYSPRRARARSEMRDGLARRQAGGRQGPRTRRHFEVPVGESFGRMPQEARQMSRRHASQSMAGELARRWDEAQKAGAAGGVLTARWAWLPVACVAVTAAALIVVLAAR